MWYCYSEIVTGSCRYCYIVGKGHFLQESEIIEAILLHWKLYCYIGNYIGNHMYCYIVNDIGMSEIIFLHWNCCYTGSNTVTLTSYIVAVKVVLYVGGGWERNTISTYFSILYWLVIVIRVLNFNYLLQSIVNIEITN